MQHRSIPFATPLLAILVLILLSSVGAYAQVAANGKIAFSGPDGTGDNEIYTMNQDGSDLRQLTNNTATEAEPAWSPDGTKIAFRTNREGNFDIWIMNADGSDPHALIRNSALELWPTWSPDGKRLAFVSAATGGGDIYVINADGTNPRNITAGSTTPDNNPAWSPDGQWIAYQAFADGNNDLYVVNVDGAPQRRRLTFSPEIDLEPAWSPDSKHLVYRYGVGNAGEAADHWDLFVMDVAGDDSTRRQLTDTPGEEESRPSWSPDGTKILYSRGPLGLNPNLWRMDSDGHNQTIVPGTAGVRFSKIQPLKANGRIVFGTDRDGNAEVYTMNPSATD